MDTYENFCMVPECGHPTIVDEYDPGPDMLHKQPETDLFCLKHYRSLRADRAARAAAEKVQCRRDGCTAQGALYPGGRWCREHVPLEHEGILKVRTAWRRQIVDVPLPDPEDSKPELPAGNLPIGENQQKNDSGSEIADVPGAVSTEAILYSTELAEDDPRIPTSVRSALKSARAHGWSARATVAISSDELFSVLLKARHPSGKQLTTRHEQPTGKPVGFKVAWFSLTPTGLPHKIGWREAMAALKGEDPTDDRPALIEAMHNVMDIGAEVLRVDVTA